MLDRITPPEVRPFGKLSLPGMRPVLLDNGIRLNIYDHSFQDVSELTVLIPGGVVDAIGSPVASMLVPVMLDGSRAYPDSALSDIFDFNGAKISPSVTDHYTSVSMRILNSHWPELLPVFADMLLAPQLSERAVAICKQRVGQSAAIAMQRVEYKAEQELRRLTYGPEHPKTQMDTPERVEAVTCEDFHAWHDRLFRQNIGGAELFLSGSVTPGMIADVNRVFGSIHIDSALAVPPYIQPFRPTAPSTAFVDSPGALQSAIRLAIPSIPRSHPDYIMLRCAVVALGGYFGSRLMTNIREDKGYTYGIQAGLLGSPEGTFMVVQTSADNMYVDAVLAEIRAEIERDKLDIGLAVIIVGNNQASRVYVNNKKKACEVCGIKSYEYALPEDTMQDELMELIDTLNKDDKVNGILCQLPLPKHLDEEKVIEAISPLKDVDAFNAVNVGKIMIGNYSFLPCTPAGVMELIHSTGVSVEGKECVVIGRSNIVGKPMAMLLLHENATITVCHSRTKDLAEVCRRADILVSAVGRADFVTADMVKDGAVVIDVGMNRNADNKLCGDVKFDEVAPKCSYITPVPGGVGPMAIAMLMKNTLMAKRIQSKV